MTKAKVTVYRLALGCLPQPKRECSFAGNVPDSLRSELPKALRRQHAVGAAVALFDLNGMTGLCTYGDAAPGMPITAETVFRTASISKHLTAMAAWRLQEAGHIDLDTDVSPYLPCPLRHPNKPDLPITLRMLLSHTAGIKDGPAYIAACTDNRPLSQLLKEDVYTDAPGSFTYSNFGAGIAACVLEGMLGKSFEEIMQQALFSPLGVHASFYAQNITSEIANAYRVLPPHKAPALDAAARHSQPLPPPGPDPEHRYLLSQGNLYISAPALARIGGELMRARYAPMRRQSASFGARDVHLSMGLSTFIVRGIVPQTLYGHQGLAYGAVHGLFYDPDAGRGVALLTSGCSEAREGVMADINIDMIRLVLDGKNT